MMGVANKHDFFDLFWHVTYIDSFVDLAFLLFVLFSLQLFGGMPPLSL
jgi:hypothetical protein